MLTFGFGVPHSICPHRGPLLGDPVFEELPTYLLSRLSPTRMYFLYSMPYAPPGSVPSTW